MSPLYQEVSAKSAGSKKFSVPLSEDVGNSPRNVALGVQGTLVVGLLGLYAAVFAYSLLLVVRGGARTAPSDLILFAGVCVFGVAVVLRMVIRSLSERKLLRSGACSTGKILFRTKSSGLGALVVRILYQFPVGGHKPMTGRGTDKTRSYKVDSPVVVFYDEQDISKYVAICSTIWRVRNTAGKLIQP